MWPFKKRVASTFGFWLSGGGDLPVGYHRLLDCPEVAACIGRISSMISSATIYLMENTSKGDKRVQDALSRFVDIDPWPGHGTRYTWMNWIVTTLLGDGDGNAFVFPVYDGSMFSALVPMPGAVIVPDANGDDYTVLWRGRTLAADEVLHFRLSAGTEYPWKGRGCRVQVSQVAASLRQTDELKRNLSSPKYKPPMVVSVNSDSDLSDDNKREKFRKKYLEDSDSGKPWILPADIAKVQQLRPLSLVDLAVKDTVELDRKTVAAIFGVPAFLLGVGSYNEKEFNCFVRTVILPICQSIEQELTLKLLRSERRYFKFNRRRLYALDLKELADINMAMSDRGYLCGDEVREDMDRDPAGLTTYEKLENYIPVDRLGDQKKLKDKEGNGNASK